MSGGRSRIRIEKNSHQKLMFPVVALGDAVMLKVTLLRSRMVEATFVTSHEVPVCLRKKGRQNEQERRGHQRQKRRSLHNQSRLVDGAGPTVKA